MDVPNFYHVTVEDNLEDDLMPEETNPFENDPLEIQSGHSTISYENSRVVESGINNVASIGNIVKIPVQEGLEVMDTGTGSHEKAVTSNQKKYHTTDYLLQFRSEFNATIKEEVPSGLPNDILSRIPVKEEKPNPTDIASDEECDLDLELNLPQYSPTGITSICSNTSNPLTIKHNPMVTVQQRNVSCQRESNVVPTLKQEKIEIDDAVYEDEDDDVPIYEETYNEFGAKNGPRIVPGPPVRPARVRKTVPKQTSFRAPSFRAPSFRPFQCLKPTYYNRIVHGVMWPFGSDDNEDLRGKGREDVPYVCGDCNKRFKMEHNLTSHLKSVHSENSLAFGYHECWNLERSRFISLE